MTAVPDKSPDASRLNGIAGAPSGAPGNIVAHPAAVPISQAGLREAAQALMLREGLSQSTVARESGIAAATLSEFLAGSYRGNNNKVADKLQRWINRRAETERINAVMPQAPGYIEAPTAKKIYDALTYAQIAGDIAVIYGGAGLSKTTTIRYYRGRNPNVWLVTATPATAGVGPLLEEIAMAMGLRDFPLHPAKLQRAVIAQVRDTGGLLVVDEAQHLTKQSLEAVRSIHDATGIGLALAGNAVVYNNLFKGGDNGFAQLFSRVGKRVPLSRPVAGDVHAVARAFGVTGKDERQALEEIARRPGALRMVVKTLRLAAMLAAGDAVAVAHIRSAWDELQGVEIQPDEARDAE